MYLTMNDFSRRDQLLLQNEKTKATTENNLTLENLKTQTSPTKDHLAKKPRQTVGKIFLDDVTAEFSSHHFKTMFR